MHVNAPWNDDREMGGTQEFLYTICLAVGLLWWVPLVLWALADKFLW